MTENMRMCALVCVYGQRQGADVFLCFLSICLNFNLHWPAAPSCHHAPSSRYRIISLTIGWEKYSLFELATCTANPGLCILTETPVISTLNALWCIHSFCCFIITSVIWDLIIPTTHNRTECFPHNSYYFTAEVTHIFAHVRAVSMPSHLLMTGANISHILSHAHCICIWRLHIFVSTQSWLCLLGNTWQKSLLDLI